jgi:hypothetical protein
LLGFLGSTQSTSFTQTNRVVIDTNVFISALLNPLGTPRKVINQSMYHSSEQGNLSRIGNENKQK